MMRAMAAPITLAVLLAACGRGGDDAAPAAQVAGEAYYLERIATPPGSTLEVVLFDLDLSNATRAVIGEVTLAVENPPYPFTLPYDPARLQDGRSYGFVARLRDPNGQQLFASDAEEPVRFHPDSTPRIRLILTPDGAETDPLAGPRGRTYQCGDLRVVARYHGRLLTVTLPGRELSLAPAVSASGARFGDDQNGFWSHGDREARLTLDGETHECESTDLPMPWEEARARGVAFRAVGQEPGWVVEVDRGERPAMRLLLDYGERRLVVDAAMPLAEGEGFRGEADGVAAELRIHREPCQDAMSGESFPVRVELRVGSERFTGCGRFLDP